MVQCCIRKTRRRSGCLRFKCTYGPSCIQHQRRYLAVGVCVSLLLVARACWSLTLIKWVARASRRATLLCVCFFCCIRCQILSGIRFYKNLEHIFIWRIITIKVFFIIASLARSLFCRWIYNCVAEVEEVGKADFDWLFDWHVKTTINVLS